MSADSDPIVIDLENSHVVLVHHGGAGTTAAGLRAGKPTVVVPFFADQPFCGQRVHQLGVGPKPLPQLKLTAKKLERQYSKGD